MTTDTTTEAHILIGALAAATVACPKLLPLPEPMCDDECICRGTGTLPHFPGARRKCGVCKGGGWVAWIGSGHAGQYYRDRHPEDYYPCVTCGGGYGAIAGTGEVPDYDVPIEALEASLSRMQVAKVNDAVTQKFYWDDDKLYDDPMPPEPEIRLTKLRAIVEVAL